jgi:hypothetical protein
MGPPHSRWAARGLEESVQVLPPPSLGFSHHQTDSVPHAHVIHTRCLILLVSAQLTLSRVSALRYIQKRKCFETPKDFVCLAVDEESFERAPDVVALGQFGCLPSTDCVQLWREGTRSHYSLPQIAIIA